MKYELVIFAGDYGLPSLDLDCLRAWIYCQLMKVKVDVKYQNNLFLNQVPYLLADGEVVGKNFSQIIDYLRKNCDSCKNQANDEEDNFLAESSMFELKPALQYLWWVDETNYNEHLRAWYAGMLPFPTNFFVPRRLRYQKITEFEAGLSIRRTLDNHDQVQAHVLDKATDYLASLNKHLKTSTDLPVSASVNILALLALLSKVPVHNKHISSYINQSEDLSKYLDKSLKLFAGSPGADSKSPFEMQMVGESELCWRDVIFSGAFATLAMIIFAVSHGIISVSDDDDDEDGEHEHYPEDDGEGITE